MLRPSDKEMLKLLGQLDFCKQQGWEPAVKGYKLGLEVGPPHCNEGLAIAEATPLEALCSVSDWLVVTVGHSSENWPDKSQPHYISILTLQIIPGVTGQQSEM